jgi:single-stranded DNA-binding protein
MIAALIKGTLWRAPEQRTSKAGKQLVSATVRAKDGDGSQFVRIVGFSGTAQAELLRLQDGDAVAVQGPLKAETYTANDGSTKVSLNLIADHVLALRQPPKERKSKPPEAPDVRSRQQRLAGSWQSPADGPIDEISF